MNSLQAWLVVGVPGVVVAAALFAGHSAVRAALGYVVLVVTMAFFLLVPGDRVSGALVGMVAVLLLAAGRGFGPDARAPEHHQTRGRYTTSPRDG